MMRAAATTAGAIAALIACGCAAPAPSANIVYYPDPPAPPRVVHLRSFRALGELVPARRSLIKRIRGTGWGSSVGAPAGVAYHDGHLYVCDRATGRVHDWDLRTGVASFLQPPDAIELRKPVAVAADDDFVYVADSERGEVVRCPTAARLGRSTHVAGQRAPPRGSVRFRPPDRAGYRPVACAVSGKRLYVADVTGHSIDVFALPGGERVASFGGAGSKPDRLYYPCGVAVSPDGDIVVSDSFNARVQRFDANGNTTRAFGQPGNRYGDMGQPRQVALGPDGVVFVTDTVFQRVHLFDGRGRLLILLPRPLDESGPSQHPVGVAVITNPPDAIAALTPRSFRADYFLVVSYADSPDPLSLFAVGEARSTEEAR